MAACDALGIRYTLPSATTAHGALLHHVTGGAESSSFQPMNVNFGLFPPMPAPRGADGRKLGHAERQIARKRAMTARALADFRTWLANETARVATGRLPIVA
jgi:methylenetetrahydrofolate--tRNA-(uracil-5-)-methyltransferase